MLYVILVDRVQGSGGKPDEETSLELNSLAKEILPVWGPFVPGLRDILLAILRGRGKDEAYARLGQVLKDLHPKGKGDIEVPIEDLDLLKAMGAYFRVNSANALAKLTKFASLSKSPWVVQRLAPKIGSQQDTKTALEQLLRSLVGRKDTALTLDEAAKVKAVKPESYKAYLELRKAFNQSWRDALVAFIRSSGSDNACSLLGCGYGRARNRPAGRVGYVSIEGRSHNLRLSSNRRQNQANNESKLPSVHL